MDALERIPDEFKEDQEKLHFETMTKSTYLLLQRLQAEQERETVCIKKEVSLVHTRNFKRVENIREVYDFDKMLGAGQFGLVLKATDREW